MRTTFLIALCTLSVQLTATENANTRSSEIGETTTELLRTETRRTARQLNIPGQEYVVRGQNSRQVIKIPSNSRVKVLQPQPPALQRPTRGGRVPNSQNSNRPRPHKTRPKRGPYDEDDYYDSPEEFKTPKKPVRKTKKGYTIQDVSPEEFYDDEQEYFQKKPKKPFPPQNQKKKYRKPNISQEYTYDSNPQPSIPQRRPIYDDETGYEFQRQKHRDQHRTPAHNSYFDDNYGHEDYGASSITMKQVAAPNLALNVIDPPNLHRESHSVKKQMQAEHQERFQNNYPTEPTPIRKIPAGRQIQSIFPQQYTTHNAYVTRNFGLEDHERAGYYNSLDGDSHEPQKNHHDFQHEPQQKHHGFEHEQQQNHHDYHHEQQEISAASSEQRPVLLPTGSSGIHIVKPPQFREPVHHIHPTVTSSSNQRATIRDILQHDCPEAEGLGYCASPPRYPTQQINSIMGKCADIIDAMYSAAPIDPEDDLSSFSSRSDVEDIEFIDSNISANSSNMVENWSQWSRSSGDGSNTICDSVLTQTEPGYAREVSSGRWFVIMQTLDSIVQRVMTDTCERPGKPCGGLAGLKCSRSATFHHSFKATRCVQRYTQQRLVSWDPESPHSCPKIRVFRFPSACLCHLSID